MEQLMRRLKLSGLMKHWQSVEFIDKKQYLQDLLSIEVKEREVNRINRLVKAAAFPVIKTLDAFVWNKNIELPQGITRQEVEDFSFIERKENLILMGAVGTGKSHLASAIGLEACQKGKKVKFYTAAGLANLLFEKNKKGLLNHFLTSLKTVDLIILDEVGFIPLHKDASELLFQVVSDSYERRSMIITSNLEFSHWNSIFGDNRLTAALVDRLIHHSHILIFSGESYRLAQSMNRISSRQMSS